MSLMITIFYDKHICFCGLQPVTLKLSQHYSATKNRHHVRILCISACLLHKLPGGWETALAVKHFWKETLLALWRRTYFMMNITLKFAGQNWMTLKECRGIYRVLWLWRGGSLFLVLRWLDTSPSVCLECGLWDWGSQWNFHGAIAIAKSLFSWSNWGVTAPSLRVLQEDDTGLHLWKFSTFHRCHRCALASFPISFSWWCRRCIYCDCKLHEADCVQRLV